VALSGMFGTISEIALALNIGKKVISLNFNLGALFEKYEKKTANLCKKTGGSDYIDKKNIK